MLAWAASPPVLDRVPSPSHEAAGAGASSVSSLVCGQLARIGRWMGQLTLSSWMGMPCTSNARPHSLQRPGGAVSWLHASEFWVHSVHNLMRHDPSLDMSSLLTGLVGPLPSTDTPEDAVGLPT